ncbi:MAG: hypothetical protein GY820_39085 [Gammaproteobacteria bacterium]|nr:hypothetical protein [Gammaproteobacteria bacterium]
MSDFKREVRYLIIKLSDLEEAKKVLHSDHLNSLEIIMAYVESVRKARGAKPLKAVVVESDWPEYGPTWDAIKKRMTNRTTSTPQPDTEKLHKY